MSGLLSQDDDGRQFEADAGVSTRGVPAVLQANDQADDPCSLRRCSPGAPRDDYMSAVSTRRVL